MGLVVGLVRGAVRVAIRGAALPLRLLSGHKRGYNHPLIPTTCLTMNSNWKNFLSANGASVDAGAVVFPVGADDAEKRIHALAHLGVLEVAGSQAGQFLQGQITCNINDVNEQAGGLAALCTPQGKVISTFLLVKTATAYRLILPQALLDTVKNRLQKYILRTDVQLKDGSDHFCLLGLVDEFHGEALLVCTQTPVLTINLGNRRLLLAEPGQAIEIWAEKTGQQGFIPTHSNHWRYLDIAAGLPWLAPETAEQFIPQMLNLDKLGGISFNKGCYTGQEVVARTHYLGKAKRGLGLLACDPPIEPVANAPITDGTGQIVGRVLNAAQYCGSVQLLCVLPTDADDLNLHLPDYPNHTLTLMNSHG